jgi:hypothetical protein
VELITPPVGFWIKDDLSEDLVQHLWTCIENKKGEARYALAGNISHSYDIPDIQSKFFKYLSTLVNRYNSEFGHPHHNTLVRREWALELDRFWVNYQKKGEFNPIHNHNGMYSFVVWLKIPYDTEQEKQAEWMSDIKMSERVAGCFSFSYTNILGQIKNMVYELNSENENMIVFFPSGLHHQVYPFYSSDEERISISGNISINLHGKRKTQNREA